MKNILTGWVTTILGLVIMITAIFDFFGVLAIPAPVGMTELQQVFYAFIVGFALFLLPRSYFEEVLKGIIKKKSDNG